MKKLLTACMLATLAACGGGGSGSSSGTGTTTPAETFRISFSTATLTFDLIEGKTTPVTRTVTATSNTTTTKAVVFTADVTGQGIVTPVTVQSAGTLASNIVIAADPTLKAGTYTGTIKLQACTTTACTEAHAGSPQTVSYTINVRAPIKPSQADVALTAVEGGTSTTLALGVTQPAGSGDVSYKVTYPAGQTTQWLKVTRNTTTGGLDLQAAATGLAIGTYTAELELVSPQPELSTKVPVNFTVGYGVVVTETVNIDLGSTTLPEAMKGEVQIAGLNAGTWTAVSSQPWLKVDTASGAVGGTMAWHVDPALAGALPNNAASTANVTVTITGVPAKTVAFRLNKHMAQLRMADTYALRPGKAGQVAVYGSGLLAVDGQRAAIRVGTFSPNSTLTSSDNLIYLNMPALDAGTYDVVLNNAAGLPVSKVALKVLDPQTYTYHAVATTGDKASLLWDGESKALFVVNAQKSVERYAAGGTGTFTRTASNAFSAGVEAIGLTRDHSAVIASTGANTFLKLSMADLSTLATWPVGSWTAQPDYMRNPLPVLGDNRAMISNYGMLDLDTGALAPYAGDPLFGLAPYGGVSPNGNIMLISGLGVSPMQMYTVATGRFSQLGQASSINPFTRSSAERAGSFWLQAYTQAGTPIFNVYSSGQTLLGTIRPPAGWTAVAGVINGEGTAVYIYATNGAGLPRIYVFNTTNLFPASGTFPILGQIPLADRADCSGAPSLPTCINNIAQMAISHDDNTLFVIGDRNLLVVPVPATLSPALRMGGKGR